MEVPVNQQSLSPVKKSVSWRRRLWSYWRPGLLGVFITHWAGSADWAHASLTNPDWMWHFKLSLGWGTGLQQYVTAALGVPSVARGWWLFRWTEQSFRDHDRTLLPDDYGDLITDGPFKDRRNPMFLGVFWFIIGDSLLTGPVACGWAVLFISFIAFVYVPFHEEPEMRKRYDKPDDKAYEKYVRDTPNRWFAPRRKKRLALGGQA